MFWLQWLLLKFTMIYLFISLFIYLFILQWAAICWVKKNKVRTDLWSVGWQHCLPITGELGPDDLLRSLSTQAILWWFCYNCTCLLMWFWMDSLIINTGGAVWLLLYLNKSNFELITGEKLKLFQETYVPVTS